MTTETLPPPAAPARPSPPPPQRSSRVRFDRNEWAGSFGDIGTDLPLLLAMIPAAGLDTASVFILFGLMQILTGIIYGLPMPIQPLKAMAVLIITGKLGASVLYGGGFAIALVMLVLTASGALTWLARVIPHAVVRGVQLGLGLKLGMLALHDYVPALGVPGYVLAGICFLITILLWENRRFPAALFIIGLGMLYGIAYSLDFHTIANGIGLAAPRFNIPTWLDLQTGFLLLALPQISLSLSNSVIATHKTLGDLYPERAISIKKLGFTYTALNLIAPFCSGIPVCHGCGGLAGHYSFGGRTGGSVIIYGGMYLVVGLFCSGAAASVMKVFPYPVLGVVLFFEALALMRLVRDVARTTQTLTIALAVGVIACSLPNGFLIGLAAGILMEYLLRRAPQAGA